MMGLVGIGVVASQSGLTYLLTAEAITALAKGFASTLGVGAGLEYADADAAGDVADGMYTALQTDLEALVVASTLVSTSEGYKLVANVGADLWSQVRSWVGERFDVGINTMPDDVEVDLSTLPTQKFALSGALYWTYGSTNYKAEMSSNGQDVRVYYKSGTTWQSVYTKTVGTGNPCYYAIDANNKLNFYKYESSPNGLFSPAFEYTSGYQSMPVQTGITGTTGIVDNPSHDIANTGTSGRDVGIDLSLVALGNSVYGFDLPTAFYSDMAGLDYTDIEAQELDGTEIAVMSEIVEAT